MENNIVPVFIPSHSSNQIQPCDLCVFGVTKRLIVHLTKLDEMNVQSIHIAKLLSAFHSACNPVNVVASFRNAGISCRFGPEGSPACFVNVEECRCLLHGITQADVENAARSDQDADLVNEIAAAADPATLPLWLAVLEEEFAKAEVD
jgi:hypothetical protein